MDGLSDTTLMLRFQSGELAAFEALYRRHRGPVYRYFLRQTSGDRAEDLFQEVWLRLTRNRARYRASGSFPAYLYRIAHNVLMDHYRAQRNEPPETDADTFALPASQADGAPDVAYDRAVLRALLAAALSGLPPEQREVFLLHQEAGLTLAEIGDVVGVGRETVKSRLRYAVSRLRSSLAQLEPREERTA